jgi:hypothetical protein
LPVPYRLHKPINKAIYKTIKPPNYSIKKTNP